MTAETAKSQTKLWLVLLLLSVALNIGLIGFLAGKISGLAPSLRGGMPPNAAIGRFVRQLDESRQRELRPLLRTHRQTLRPGAIELRKAHGALQTALATEPLNTRAIELALDSIASTSGQRSPAFNQSFIDLVKALTQAERQLLANSLQRGRGHRRRAPPE